MITISELYQKLNAAIPPSLSCEWDHDGLMCCPNPEKPVKKVLLALDITAKVALEAISGGYDLIVSHHPLVFHPLASLTTTDAVAHKLIRLVENGIAAMSFHTRFDAVSGGVNDALAAALGLKNAVPFGNEEGEMGRIGDITPCTLPEFAAQVKKALGAPFVHVSGNLPARRVAVLGGGGSDFVMAALAAGADTYVSGELAHHHMAEAREHGINLIAAGHFHTENIALPALATFLKAADSDIDITITDANESFVL